MKLVLLAAGSSSRAWPIPDKNFVEICGKPLIEWQLEGLLKAGFHDFVVVGNALNLSVLKSFLTNYQERSVSKDPFSFLLVEQADLESGMAGALLACEEYLQEEFMVVSTNDIVEDVLWDETQRAVSLNEESGFIVGYKVHRYFPGGYLRIAKNDLIEGIVEKPGEGNEPSDMVNLVIHVHRQGKRLFEEMKRIREVLLGEDSALDDLYERALDALFKAGAPYRVLPYAGYWQALKYPWHVLRLLEFFLDRLEPRVSPKAFIAPTAVLNGQVVIEDGVKVLDHAVINGPAYIGAGSLVGNFALVRGSSIGKHSVVGSYTEICRSNLGNEVWTHKNYVGDSIIGNNVSFGSGTVTGNLRLDEAEINLSVKGERLSSRTNKLGLICGSDVRVGIHTSFMPGIRIGSGSVIGAGLTLYQDVPDASYVKVANSDSQSFFGGIEIRKNTKPLPKRQARAF